MKKTLITTFMTLLLCVCMIFGLTACGNWCDHVYDNIFDSTCNKCNEERTVAHDLNAADCINPTTCSICGKTEGSALGHEWTTPDVDLCVVQSICSRCGATDGENKEHTPAVDDGDCFTEVKCMVCGDVTTPAGQHTPNNDDGNCLTEITCSVCGTVTTPARDSHTGGTATCTEKAVCTVCSTAFGAVDANNHIDENTDHICDRECGMTNLGTHADSDEDNDHVCDYGCKEILEDHKGGTATCVAQAVCTICGNGYGDLAPNNHASDEFTYTANTDGTTHTKKHKCCDAVASADEEHTFNANICICGAIQITDVNAPNDADHPFGDGWSNDEEEVLDSGASIGTQDVGKTAWVNEDQIIVTLISETIGTQTCVLTYNGGNWTLDGSFVYAEGETPTVSVIYAPCYEVTEEGVMQLKDGMQLGMTEYLVGEYEIGDGFINVSFANATRNYSRLRISALSGQTLTVTTNGFTPAGATSEATEVYTITTDDNGNAFLYGTFAVGATVSVKYGNVVLKDYAFTAENNPNGTEQGKSYVLDARPIIDGTFGGKATATEEDIKALVEQIKTYVDNGITTIIVTGEEPAKIDMGTYTSTAIGEAIYRLSGSGTYDADNQYNGKIDLILSDVTEIIEYEFQGAYALNSITLPNVTKLGYYAFYDCKYLKEITFGSVVTEGSLSIEDFMNVGTAVGGCALTLNRGQFSAAAEYQPDPNSMTWWETEWNYIELI